MDNCFWILVWDDFGCGLELINPRILDFYDEKSMKRYNSIGYTEKSEIEDFLDSKEIEQTFGNNFKVIIWE